MQNLNAACKELCVSLSCKDINKGGSPVYSGQILLENH